MKRDMDLIRKILIQLESYSPDDAIMRIELDDYSSEQIAYHVYLLKDANLILAKILFGGGYAQIESYAILGLTWGGHDFIDASRDDTRWRRAKDIFTQMGSSVSFDVIKEILFNLMISQMPRIITPGV
jgi:hypothetical protein